MTAENIIANTSPPSISRARILALETSCDETAAAVVENGRTILSNAVASQVDLHAQFGGVFPEVASRQHILMIYPILEMAMQEAHLSMNEVDAIAVTRGPGLPGSLVVGMNMAKGLAIGSNLPLIGINHLEAHLYSAWLDKPQLSEGTISEAEMEKVPEFPLVGLIVSGGHTELVLMLDHLKYQRLGGTLDDAAGEAFDKIARLLGLAYPGGPAIQIEAEGGDPQSFRFPRAWLDEGWNFSFSGLKTAVLKEVKKIHEQGRILPIADIAASFQTAVVDVLVGKTVRAAKAHQAKEILVVGGVSANQELRRAFKKAATCPIHIPPVSLCTDNAAMVAGAGFYRFLNGQSDSQDIDVLPNWPISEL